MASDDPDFEQKATDVIGLYVNPPDYAAVFAVDEKTAIHALDRLDPVWPLENRNEYKQMMDLADTPRQGDLDGRGNLSERALVDFVGWFLRVAIDQVTFMSSLFDIDALAGRLRTLVAQRDLKLEAARLLEEALVRGEN